MTLRSAVIIQWGNLTNYTMVNKTVSFIRQGVDYKVICPPESDIYDFCKMLDEGGAENITLHTTYETWDDLYVQGRSTRNLPDIPSAKRQLELF